MSEGRKKRANKKNRAGMRRLQAREKQPNLQAETEPMPQPEGQAMAERDRTNTETEGGKMRESFIDKIREHKTIIIEVIVVVAIAVIVNALMTSALAPSKGEYTNTVTELQGNDARASASINSLATSLNSRMDDVEAAAQAATDKVTAMGANTTKNSADIETLQTWVTGAEGWIATVEAQTRPPEAYLTTNSTGNYTLHAKCSEPGNFTANVHLIYAAPIYVGNTTDYVDTTSAFYAGVNWTSANTTTYVPTITYNGTDWGISQVWFNIGTFTLAADTEAEVAVLFSGLNSTYNPAFSYVEVYPVLK
jgi:hypothetical protein